MAKNPNGLTSKKVACVTLVSVSIGSLKVKTIVVLVETPPAPSCGDTESNVGCACVCDTAPSAPAKINIATKRFGNGNSSGCMVWIQGTRAGFVTLKKYRRWVHTAHEFEI